MRYWTVNIWQATKSDISKDLELLKTQDYDAVILFCYLESDFSLLTNRYNILNVAKNKNIPVYIILGAESEKSALPAHIHVISWPTYFFKETLVRYHRSLLDLVKLQEQDYKYHYVYLNGKSHKWRCFLIDQLARLNLLKYSAYSWHVDQTQVQTHRFEYFDGKVRILDSDFNLNNQGHGFIPEEYNQAFFQLVPETSVRVKFITEKTILPLLMGKPFIVSGVVGFHQWLKSLGFELYDELFDYSFDAIDDDQNRYQAISAEVKRITELSLEQCREFHGILHDKIIHNKNRAWELAYDTSLVPDLAKLVLQRYHLTGEVLDQTLIDVESKLNSFKEKVTKY